MSIEYFWQQDPTSIKATKRVPEGLVDRLPKGLAVPPKLNRNKWATCERTEKIKQNIYVTLVTPVSRRLFQNDFGSMLPWMLFEGYDDLLSAEMIDQTKLALKLWVPHIRVEKVVIDENLINEHAVILVVVYAIMGTAVLDAVGIVLESTDKTLVPLSYYTISGRKFFT